MAARNWLDSAIATVAPGWAVSRARNRSRLALYEAAQSNPAEPARRRQRSSGAADRAAFGGCRTLRDRARWLDENHDLAGGVLDTLVNWTIGPHGITVEPQPRAPGGDIHTELADMIRAAWLRWSWRVDTTGEHTRAALERLLARSKYRDGEVFARHIVGRHVGLSYPSDVPFLVEGLESDYCPLYHTSADDWHMGVKKNQWGRPVAYQMYDRHPGNFDTRFDLTERSADEITHLKTVKRLEQTRGISVFANVMNRLADLKDYEESERVAARVAAALTGYIKKGSPDMYDPDSAAASGAQPGRDFEIAPGLIFDNLSIGEEVGIIQGQRPNPELLNFRNAMMRAIAAGVGVSYSTTARDYNGTYSAQRQELVEQFAAYAALTADFVGQYETRVYRRFIDVARLAGVIPSNINVNWETIYDAEYKGPVMPWVDPLKEANANVVQVQAGFKTRSQVIRERAGDPATVMRERAAEQQAAAAAGLSFSSDADPATVETTEDAA